jgi:CRP-like cAMP-binding protein
MADRKALVGLLGSVPLFEGLSKKELDQIVSASKQVNARAGHSVVVEGESGVGFHLILEGKARVSRSGRKLRNLGPGDSFGDIALIDGGVRSASVTAETDLSLLSLTTWQFKPLLLERPQITYKLLLQLCSRLRDAEKRQTI